MQKLQESVRNNRESTKHATCLQMNPNLSEVSMYKTNQLAEYLRIAYTRFRLSSHSLHIEKGRWSKKTREHRTCICNNQDVQDEHHALLMCPITLNIRLKYNITQSTLAEFFKEHDNSICAEIIYECLKLLEN